MQHFSSGALRRRLGFPLELYISSYRDSAKLVSTTPNTFDPEHSNVVIHRDGNIAAVYFDFVFNVDGKANNCGSETWQLVKAADCVHHLLFRAAYGAIETGEKARCSMSSRLTLTEPHTVLLGWARTCDE